jgi:hypothetical protein
VDDVFNADMANVYKKAQTRVPVEGKDFTIGDGDVTIAAITSCTNTSNPGVLVAAGLVAKKADELGLKPKPWSRPRWPPARRSSPTIWNARSSVAPRQHRLQPVGYTAAPPASATRASGRTDQQGDQRERPRCRRRDLGQPQLRRPRVA